MQPCSHKTSRIQGSPDISVLLESGETVPDYLNEYTLYDIDDGNPSPFFTAILSDQFLGAHGLDRQNRSEITDSSPDWIALLHPICLKCLELRCSGPLKRSKVPGATE